MGHKRTHGGYDRPVTVSEARDVIVPSGPFAGTPLSVQSDGTFTLLDYSTTFFKARAISGIDAYTAVKLTSGGGVEPLSATGSSNPAIGVSVEAVAAGNESFFVQFGSLRAAVFGTTTSGLYMNDDGTLTTTEKGNIVGLVTDGVPFVMFGGGSGSADPVDPDVPVLDPLHVGDIHYFHNAKIPAWALSLTDDVSLSKTDYADLYAAYGDDTNTAAVKHSSWGVFEKMTSNTTPAPNFVEYSNTMKGAPWYIWSNVVSQWHSSTGAHWNSCTWPDKKYRFNSMRLACNPPTGGLPKGLTFQVRYTPDGEWVQVYKHPTTVVQGLITYTFNQNIEADGFTAPVCGLRVFDNQTAYLACQQADAFGADVSESNPNFWISAQPTYGDYVSCIIPVETAQTLPVSDDRLGEMCSFPTDNIPTYAVPMVGDMDVYKSRYPELYAKFSDVYPPAPPTPEFITIPYPTGLIAPAGQTLCIIVKSPLRDIHDNTKYSAAPGYIHGLALSVSADKKKIFCDRGFADIKGSVRLYGTYAEITTVIDDATLVPGNVFIYAAPGKGTTATLACSNTPPAFDTYHTPYVGDIKINTIPLYLNAGLPIHRYVGKLALAEDGTYEVTDTTGMGGGGISEVPISKKAGNITSMEPDGIYTPAQSGEGPLTVTKESLREKKLLLEVTVDQSNLGQTYSLPVDPLKKHIFVMEAESITPTLVSTASAVTTTINNDPSILYTRTNRVFDGTTTIVSKSLNRALDTACCIITTSYTVTGTTRLVYAPGHYLTAVRQAICSKPKEEVHDNEYMSNDVVSMTSLEVITPATFPSTAVMTIRVYEELEKDIVVDVTGGGTPVSAKDGNIITWESDGICAKVPQTTGDIITSLDDNKPANAYAKLGSTATWHRIADYPKLFAKYGHRYLRDIEEIIVPQMTSNTAPAPFVASTSSQYSAAWAVWRLFDRVWGTDAGWTTVASVPTAWVQLLFGTDELAYITKYTLRGTANATANNSASWKTWEFLSGAQSDAAAPLTQLNSVTGAPAWAANEARTYVIPDDKLLLAGMLKINITERHTNYYTMGEVQVYGVIMGTRTLDTHFVLPAVPLATGSLYAYALEGAA